MRTLHFSDPDFLQQSESYWFYGIILSTIGYGINITLFAACINLLVHELSHPKNRRLAILDRNSQRQRLDILSISLTFLMFSFATASIIPIIIVGEGAFVKSQNLPGGPSQDLYEHVFVHVTTLKVLCSTAVLLWRWFQVYKVSVGRSPPRERRHINRLIMILPFCLLFTSLATGIIFVMQAIAPSRLSDELASKNWVLIWGTIATILSCGLTGVLSIRLLLFRCALLKDLGKHLQIDYTGIATILVESTALLSSFTVFFMVAFSVKSPSLVMVPFLLTQVQVISPLLVTYRVMSRRVRTKEDTQECSIPTFADSISTLDSRETSPPKVRKMHSAEYDGLGTFHE